MNKEIYMQQFEESRQRVLDIAAGRTGHTRRDVAYNQIEHSMALCRASVEGDVPYFKCSDVLA